MIFSPKLLAGTLMLTVLLVSGCKEKISKYDTDLTVWGVFDNEGDYGQVFTEYSKANPFIRNMQYRKFTIDTYKQDLINALAAGNNPDIFMIHSSWLPEFFDKVAPSPEGMYDTNAVRSQLVDVAGNDMIFDGRLYGLAPSVDSLGLYYNRDIFNAAGITAPPATWNEFDAAVKNLRRIGREGQIVQSGATFGTAENISRPTDLLTLLMLQGGAEMTRGGNVYFDKAIITNGQTVNPGRDALLYYTSFARGGSEVYTWNKAQHYSIDAFTEGTSAMTLTYSYNYDTIRTKNEKLNFAVAPVPQIDVDTLGRQANYANYWMYVVAKNRSVPPKAENAKFQITNDMKIWDAWQFLGAFTLAGAGNLTMTSPLDGVVYEIALPSDLAQTYLTKTQKPAARKDLIELQKRDERLSAFARGNLISRNWLRKNADDIDGVFYEMIDEVNKGQNLDRALELGAQRTQQLLR